MQKVLIIPLIIITVLFSSFYAQPIEAAKVLPQVKSSKKTVTTKRSSGSLVTVTPKLRRDRKALLIYFGGLQNANSVSYLIIYTTNGQEEGAGGSVDPSQGNTSSREILFGTCSKNVCRYHTNITNMRLEATADLKSGKKLIKRYKIRI